MADEIDPQKSEVHEATEDASTSPANRPAGQASAKLNPDQKPENLPASPRQDANSFPPEVKVKRDDSDVGGPIVVETDQQ